MRLHDALPLVLFAACSNTASKEESVQIFAAASAAMSSGQSRAVTEARGTAHAAPTDLTLDWAGPCTLGGTVSVRGAYTGDRDDDHAAFDLRTTFDGCRELTGTLDGELRWTSVADGAAFSAAMTGGLDWEGSDGSASCDFDLELAVAPARVSYGGHLCGYDVRTELLLGP